MTKTDAMFWSGETLRERLAPLIEPFAPDRVDCAAYTLSVGPEVFWLRATFELRDRGIKHG